MDGSVTVLGRNRRAEVTATLGLSCGRSQARGECIGARAASFSTSSWSRLRAELEPELRWDEAGFEDRLVARVREDFAAGRVESVDGWLLSETEAKLYAPAELLPGGKR